MQKSELRSGVIISYANLALSTLIPLIYTPVMLKMLGQAEYGLFSLASSAVSYLSLLSFGFGSTIIRYISKYRAENDLKSEEETYGFFLLLYCVLAIIVLFCGGVISRNIENIFQKGLTSDELEKLKYLVLVMTFNSALSFPNSVFSSMITAHEKYIFKKLVDMLATVAAPLANLVALYLGFKSIGMAMAATIIQCLMMPINIVYCSKKLKLKPRKKLLPPNLIKEMIGFSVFIFVGTIVDMLFWTTDKVILGMLSGSVAVAIYNVGGTFNHMIMNLSTAISGVLMPKVTGMVVSEASKEELSQLFIRVGRLQFVIIALVVSGFAVFGKTFIGLWAGDSYDMSYWITILTMFPLCIPLIQNTGLTIITAQNKHRFRSVLYLIIAIVNVISTYMIVPYYSALGAALCSCVSYVIGQGFVMNFYYYKVIGLKIPLFWKNIIKMLRIPLGLTILGLLIVANYNIKNWVAFFGGVFAYTIIYSVLMYFFAFNEYEKNIIRQPVLAFIKDLNDNGWRR